MYVCMYVYMYVVQGPYMHVVCMYVPYICIVCSTAPVQCLYSEGGRYTHTSSRVLRHEGVTFTWSAYIDGACVMCMCMYLVHECIRLNVHICKGGRGTLHK
jgi:hypothetical protein